MKLRDVLRDADLPRKHTSDTQILVSMGLLTLVGLIVIYSVSPALSYNLFDDVGQNYFLYRQIVNIAIGLAAFIVAAIIPHTFWSKHINFFVGTTGVMFLLMLTGLGASRNGATRWLDIGPISFQPSELLKITLIIYFAAFLSSRITTGKINDLKETFIPLLSILGTVSLFVVIFQKDMGTMIAALSIVVGMYFLSGVGWKHLGYLASIGGVAGIASIVFFPHRVSRLLTFLSPENDVLGAGYHINQALIAVGSGGLFGLGLGRSVQVYGYLPEAANDSIFAIFAEKFGFIGSVAVLLLFAWLLHRIYIIAINAPNDYSKFLAIGVFLWIASHVVINVGAMLSLIPLTGITLPFLSYGGSSLIAMMFGLGIVFNVSKYTDREVRSASNRQRRRNRGAYNPNPRSSF